MEKKPPNRTNSLKPQNLVSSFLNVVRTNGRGSMNKYSKTFSSSGPFATSTSLVGKVALVTGSSRSIGAAIARSLGEQGANVVVNYINDSKAADEVVQSIRAQGKGGAVAVKADAGTMGGGQVLLDETIKAFGRLDILILNAGMMGNRPLAEVDEKYFDMHFEANVKVPLFMAKAASSILPSPGGRIIFISTSLTDATSVSPNSLCFVASKGAVDQIVRVLGKDLGTKGITVNAVSPGPVDTTLFRSGPGRSQQVIDVFLRQSPSKRLGEPDDIAPMVSFLSSQAAQWINGQNIRANGGFVV